MAKEHDTLHRMLSEVLEKKECRKLTNQVINCTLVIGGYEVDFWFKNLTHVGCYKGVL
jgi:hypothetical protein